MSDINVMDTTLRDGSYTVDFNFSIGDTKTICSELESAGIKYIEIGHGIGIGAALIGHKPAIHTDAEYIQAAKSIVKNSKIGMFSITKMTPLDSIKEIARQGLDFIRIGSDIANVSYIPKYVETAKNAGLISIFRGSNGARLTKSATQISLLDIFYAVESTPKSEDSLTLKRESKESIHKESAYTKERVGYTLFRFHTNPNLLCPLGKNIHSLLDSHFIQAQRVLEEYLASVKLSDLLEELRTQHLC